MIGALKNLTINKLGKWMISFMVLSVLLTLASSWYVVKEVTSLNTSWTNNERSITQRHTYLSALRGSIGYGGMIHYFKNYLLRHDNLYLLSTHRSILETKILINGYRVLGVSKAEDNALKNLDLVVQNYRNALARAESLINAGYTIAETDKLVAVDDEPAVRALLSLTDAVSSIQQAKTKDVSQKIESMAKTITFQSIGIGILLVIMILSLAWFFRFRLIIPLNKLITTIGLVDPSAPGLIRLPITENKNDELSLMARAVNRFLDSVDTHLAERRNAEKSLEAAKEEADNANQAKSEFLSSMSHELRTPLNAILGFGQILEMNHKERLSNDQKFAVDHINIAGSHLLSLINDVLDLSKIESNEIDISIECVYPQDIFKECLELSLGLAEKNGISLNDKRESDYGISADYNRLKQILLNLLSNAIKYNKVGGSVTCGCMDQPNDIVRIYVSDTGNGISDEKIFDLFAPFNRLGMENSKIEGTGIGLTISKRLTEEMGGEIGCDSEIGKGSTFWVDFPKAQRDFVPRVTKDQISHAKTSVATDSMAGTILYVEDNPANRDLMEMILSGIEGLTLNTAPTAEIGIEIAEQILPDLILMDINLPGISGIEALEVLRQKSETKDIPVIAVSANAIQEDIRKAMESGFEEYITKPFDITDVITTVSNVLGRHIGAAESENEPTAAKDRTADQYLPLAEQDISRILSTVQALPSSYRSILESQASSLSPLIAEIRQAHSTKDFHTAEASAHKFKTNSRTFGAQELGSLAQEVETSANKKQDTDIPQLLDRMEEEYKTVAPIIERLLADLRSDAEAEDTEKTGTS